MNGTEVKTFLSITYLGREFQYLEEIPASKFVAFLERIQFEESCWIWMGGRWADYGAFCWQNRNIPAHRFAWISMRGPIPAGHQIHHKCENPSCVNPDHLEPLEPDVHLLEHTPANPVYAQKRRQFCPKGHPLFGDNVRYAYEGKWVHRVCKTCRREWEADKRKRNTGLRPKRTHCRNGHEYTPENLLIDHVGHKRCRICHNAASAKSYEKRTPEKPPAPPKTHCVNGHPWIPENWLHSKRGGKDTIDCMICHKEGAKRSYEKRKAQVAAERQQSAPPSATLDLGGEA